MYTLHEDNVREGGRGGCESNAVDKEYIRPNPIMMVDSMTDNLREKNRKRTSMLKR